MPPLESMLVGDFDILVAFSHNDLQQDLANPLDQVL